MKSERGRSSPQNKYTFNPHGERVGSLGFGEEGGGGGPDKVLINIGKISETINKMKQGTSRRRRAQQEMWGAGPSVARAELMAPDRARVQVQITAKKSTAFKALVRRKPRLGVKFVSSRIGAGEEERQLSAAPHRTPHRRAAQAGS